MGRLAASIVVFVGAIGSIQPTLAQSIDETIGFISEKATAADNYQALKALGGCTALFSSINGNFKVDISKLSKSSIRFFSETDEKANVVVNGFPKKHYIDVQCFEDQCLENVKAPQFSRRKITMNIIYEDHEKVTKAWTHLLNQCGAKERKQLF